MFHMEQSLYPDQNTLYGADYVSRSECSVGNRVGIQVRITHMEQDFYPYQNEAYGTNYVLRIEVCIQIRTLYI